MPLVDGSNGDEAVLHSLLIRMMCGELDAELTHLSRSRTFTMELDGQMKMVQERSPLFL